MSHIFDEKIAELTTERDRIRVINAKLLEACKQLLRSVECEYGFDDDPEAQPATIADNEIDVLITKARAAIAAAEK